MSQENITLVVGIVGSTIILVAFLLNQLDKIKNNSFVYDFLNLLGSLLLGAYALLLESVPFLILNFVWAAFSLKDVIRKLK